MTEAKMVAVMRDLQAWVGNPFGPALRNPYGPGWGILSAHDNYQILKVSPVKLTVYDILGREVETLVNETKQPGRYEATFNATSLANGVYLYRLQAGSFVETRKLVLVR